MRFCLGKTNPPSVVLSRREELHQRCDVLLAVVLVFFLFLLLFSHRHHAGGSLYREGAGLRDGTQFPENVLHLKFCVSFPSAHKRTTSAGAGLGERDRKFPPYFLFFPPHFSAPWMVNEKFAFVIKFAASGVAVWVKKSALSKVFPPSMSHSAARARWCCCWKVEATFLSCANCALIYVINGKLNLIGAVLCSEGKTLATPPPRR